MARPNIEQLRGLGDFATLYNWNIFITKGPNAGVGDLTTMNTNLRCTSTTLPILSDKKITVAVRSHKVYQPGIHDYSNQITFTFVETVDSKVNRWLKQWREKCYRTKDGYHEKKADVEAELKIERLDRQDKPIWQYRLIGCFLENYTQSDLQADASETFNPSMTISYDYFVDSGSGMAEGVGSGSFSGN